VAGAATTVILALLAPSGDDEAARAEGPQFGVDYTIAPVVAHGGSNVGGMLTTRF
jgi:hypothetical protein